MPIVRVDHRRSLWKRRIGKRTFSRGLRWGTILLGLGIGLKPVIGFAQTDKSVKQHVLPDQELAGIKRRLDKLTKNHEALLKAIEEIKADIAIVKVRVTN